MISLVHLRMALITFANPEKNAVPSIKSETASSSSKEAPAQNAPSPWLFKMIKLIWVLLLKAFNSSDKRCNNSLGNELLAGCPNSTVAILFCMAVCKLPLSCVIGIIVCSKIRMSCEFCVMNFMFYKELGYLLGTTGRA